MSPHNLFNSPDLDQSPPYLNAGSPYSMTSLSDLSSPYENSDTSSTQDVEVNARRGLLPGIYCPTVAFFHPDTEDLDLECIASHAVRLARAGLAGITTQGSNGEAVHLTHKERTVVTRTTRKALDDAGFVNMPIIVGCGSQSTRETIDLCREAQEAGGDYALVLPPSYYKGLFTSDTALTFFRDVAEASPIPILIYNFPGAASGLDLDSDTIIALAEHPNIIGCKLTCGNTGKLNRIAAATRAATPTEHGSGFMCMGGSADFTLQTLIGGGSGIVGGLANIAPKSCVRLVQLYEAGKLREARSLQAVVARGDWAAIQGGIIGTKAALKAHFNYGGFARKPLPRPSSKETFRWNAAFDELVSFEKSL